MNTHTVIYIRGNRAVLSAHLLHPPILLGFTAQSTSQRLYIYSSSHHFTQLSASTSLFLLIAHNNPPKSLPGSECFPNSQNRNTMAAQREAQASRGDQSLWWMHTHLWEISSADKMDTYWFLVFSFFQFFPPLLQVIYIYLKDWVCETVLFEDNEITLNIMNISKKNKLIWYWCSGGSTGYTLVLFQSSLTSFLWCGNCVKGADTCTHSLQLVITLTWELKQHAAVTVEFQVNANNLQQM